MRRKIITLLLSIVALLPAAAQKDLAIADLFDGRFQKRGDAVEILLKGQNINGYNLSLFRSLILPVDQKSGLLIEKKVRADAALAVEKEVGYKENRLYYGFFRLPPRRQQGPNRFIFFRNNGLRKDRKPMLTLIYMESTANMEELRRTFSK